MIAQFARRSPTESVARGRSDASLGILPGQVMCIRAPARAHFDPLVALRDHAHVLFAMNHGICGVDQAVKLDQ